ncbi:MAG: sulfur carrier protein ThiS [Planctomycetota bacterium]
MIIYVNSKPQKVPENASVAALLEILSLTEKRVAIEVNKELVTKREWTRFKLKAGDRVEVVSFVGGG